MTDSNNSNSPFDFLLSNTSTAQERQYNSSTNKSGDSYALMQGYADIVERVKNLEKDICLVKKEQEKTRDFYESIKKLSDISKNVIWGLTIIPIVQLVLFYIVVYRLGIQNEISILQLILGGLGVMTVIECILIYRKKDQINLLEKKVDFIQNQLDDTKNQLDAIKKRE